MRCPKCDCELDATLTVVEKPLGPVPKLATDATRSWLITQLNANPGEGGRIVLLDFCRAMKMIGEKEQIEDLPLNFVPTSINQLRQFQAVLDNFANGEQGKVPVDNRVLHQHSITGEHKLMVPERPKVTGWRAQVIHLTRMAGKHLGQLTLEELQSWDAEFRPVDSWTDADGVKHDKKPESIAKDRALRKALDEAMAELGAIK